MRRFLWKIAGADIDLLEKSGKESQYSFWLIGLLYIVVVIITYIGFLGMFWGVFESIFPTLIGAFVLGFLVTMIYKLSLISLEPNTLPVIDEKTSKLFSNIVRYFTIILFAFFVSKSVEMIVVKIIEYSGLINNEGSSGYLIHMKKINTEQPWIWGITGVIMFIFIIPIYLRHRLNRANQYYLFKRLNDKELVKREYKNYLLVKEEILNRTYRNYEVIIKSSFDDKNGLFFNKKLSGKTLKLKEQLLVKKMTQHPKKYSDEPFNTKRIVSTRNLKNSGEFLDAILSK
jgi:hypothetical protein